MYLFIFTGGFAAASSRSSMPNNVAFVQPDMWAQVARLKSVRATVTPRECRDSATQSTAGASAVTPIMRGRIAVR